MRLAGRAKAGFYPTPQSVVKRIIPWIKQEPGLLRILDPCCGLGDPLKWIAEHTGAESYGIELDRQRAAIAKEKLSHLVRADALAARISPASFSLLFLNPPYDQDEKTRLEYRFLVQTSAWLAPRGLLIYLIPENRFHANTLRYLASWYEHLRLFRFPEPDYQRFKQTVCFGVKKQKASIDLHQHDQFKNGLSGTVPYLPDEATPVYGLPPLSPDQRLVFRSNEIDPEEVLPELAAQGAWQLVEVKENLEPCTTTQSVRPLMPLRQGHLAQLIAAGFINNQVLEKGSKKLLIKGRTVKQTVMIPSSDEGTRIERDVIHTTIMALDERGKFIEIGEGG